MEVCGCAIVGKADGVCMSLQLGMRLKCVQEYDKALRVLIYIEAFCRRGWTNQLHTSEADGSGL